MVFNENDVLRAIVPAGALPMASVRVFYNDEHALTLGVRSVAVKTASGTTTTDYPVSSLTSNPGSVTNAQTGANELAGNQSGFDQSQRPMWPVLFVTDVTSDPTSRSGDWQMGGKPYSPSAVFGSWKAAVRTVDTTVSPADRQHRARRGSGQEQLEPRDRQRPGPHRPRQRGLRRRGALGRLAHARSLVPLPGHGSRRRSEQGGRRLGRGLPGLLHRRRLRGRRDRVPDQRGQGDLRSHTTTGGGCPAGTTDYLVSEGAVCVPTPTGGTCPSGYQLDPTSEGSRCI